MPALTIILLSMGIGILIGILIGLISVLAILEVL